MRKSSLFLVLTAANTLLWCCLIFLHPWFSSETSKAKIAEEKRLVRKLGITDLCLFTEARYTRHLSQVDLHSAFQDHPMSLEHFPSGSLVLPPDQLWHFKGKTSTDAKIVINQAVAGE